MLDLGCIYIDDVQGKSPLDYAIEKKSFESSSILLEFILKKR